MRDSNDPAPARAKDPVTLAAREAAPPLAAGLEPFAALGISGGVRGLQRAVGNRATQRLLTSSAARAALRRSTRRSGPVLARQDDDPVAITREFTLPAFLHPMEASAEREYDQPPVAVPDFSGDTPANTLSSLEPGNHVWYWNGNSSTAKSIPRDDWFAGHSGDPLDYQGNGGKIYNFVIYPDHVKCGQPQMTNKTLFPGSFAWLNNNPGNLSGPTADIGQYAGKLNGSPPKTPGFLVFPTPDIGRAAIRPWLAHNGGSNPYIDRSIADAWLAYDKDDAPRYTKLITDALGVQASTILSSLTDAQWETLLATIKQAEGTLLGWTYSRGDRRLPAAIRNAL
jgi:hypothetical protein